MNASVKDLMNEDARKLFDKEMSERAEFVAQRALLRALEDDRRRAGERDVREALEELKPKKRTRHSLFVQIIAFLSSFAIFQFITNYLTYSYINHYFTPIDPEKYTAVATLLAAAISAGVVLCVAFYRFILRDRL